MRILKGILLIIGIMMMQPGIDSEAALRSKKIEEIQSKDDTMIESLDEFLSKNDKVEESDIVNIKNIKNSKIEIINKNLTWNEELDYTNKPKKIVMHHIEASRTNSNVTVEEVHQWHKNNGWAGIGYHFYINKNGKIYIGRPENAIGAHALNNNIDTIGIAVEGKYQTEYMPSVQKEAVKLLGKYLRQKYGIETINKHQDLVATSCPGKNYPFTEIKDSIKEEVLKETKIYKWERKNDRLFLLDTWRGIYENGQVVYKGKTYNVSSSKGILDTGIIEIDNQKYYIKTDSTYAKGWIKASGNWYYFGTDGAMQTGWQYINNKWYYLNDNGTMKTGWMYHTDKWYYLDGSGEMKTGWVNDNYWYFMDNDGSMVTKGRWINGSWYDFNSNGTMKTGWEWIDNAYYYLGNDGAMKTGWQWIEDAYYYLGSDGAMRTRWQWVQDAYYYLGYSGKMTTGWNYIDNEWYYLNYSGKMATNTIIDGWQIGYSGIAKKIS
ncbi:MAG: N-acetylmuramoyl-L-alanine amidase [Clostridium sp.]|uniref:N-acetylmuramoyl-L-alanine amidase n=1 Tax=Clostridium sp. TaxID=1506 RepID=UPI003F306F3C